ncbi:MAG: hypothetical protein QNJ38_00960 [Prochloraceae cyanobacterium]|nr:hypothetical protein [Prochloraceae cyanobacterium]
MNRNIYIAIAAVVLLSIAASLSGGDPKFRRSVNSAIAAGNNREINSQLQRLFEEEYGWEKAKQEAKEYCQELEAGKTRQEIFADRFKYRELDSSGEETTAQKGAYLKMIKIIIYHAAEKSYCPQGTGNNRE